MRSLFDGRAGWSLAPVEHAEMDMGWVHPWVSSAIGQKHNGCPDLHICPACVTRPPLLLHLPRGQLR